MADDRGEAGSILKVDGGAANNDLLMQMQSDLLDRPVSRPETVETTALGAAMLAGLAVGFWSDTDELARGWQEERSFQPQAGKQWQKTLLSQWSQALNKT
jgi:glycerol kinase